MRRRQAVPRMVRGRAVPVRSVLAFGALMLGALLAVAAIVLGTLLLLATVYPALVPEVP